jgi:hypothetical protein
MHSVIHRRLLLAVFVLALPTLTSAAQIPSDTKQSATKKGFARVEKVDAKRGTLLLLVKENQTVEVSVEGAQLSDIDGKKTKLTDFREGQFVEYSWTKYGPALQDIKLAKTFCKKDGPTVCESERQNKPCHKNCSDGPCACPK